MKCTKLGTEYTLENRDNPANTQLLTFIDRQPSKLTRGKNTPAPMTTNADGITLEELLTVALDRTIFLDRRLPCTENVLVAHHLELALTLLNNRTQDRVARGVEGTAQR